MKLVRSMSKDGNVWPAAYGLLSMVPPEALNHTHHGLRHPLAIYNSSVAKVFGSFSTVLDELDALPTLGVDEHGNVQFHPDRILKAQEDLLGAVMSHIDDCYHILKSLTPPIFLRKEIPFADKWLEAAKHPTVRYFKDSISDYRNNTATILNKIKHEHGRLRSVLFVNEQYRVPGYYLEGVDHKEVVGPDPRVHPNNGAFSYYRDLRYHLIHVFIIGHHLKNAIVRALDKQHGVTVPDVVRFEDDSHAVRSLAERIAALPGLFFSDEITKRIPAFSIETTDSGVTVSVSFPGSMPVFWPGTMRIQAQTTGDGVTRSFRFPYMQNRPWGSP